VHSGDPDGVAAVKQRMPFMKSKPLLLGKLRVRLSTVAPGKTWTRALPMLAGRRNGGEHTATAHLSMRVCGKTASVVSIAAMAVGWRCQWLLYCLGCQSFW
jgi:hypothetical protein